MRETAGEHTPTQTCHCTDHVHGDSERQQYSQERAHHSCQQEHKLRCGACQALLPDLLSLFYNPDASYCPSWHKTGHLFEVSSSCSQGVECLPHALASAPLCGRSTRLELRNNTSYTCARPNPIQPAPATPAPTPHGHMRPYVTPWLNPRQQLPNTCMHPNQRVLACMLIWWTCAHATGAASAY